MPTDDRLTSLAFLLSLPSVAVGCAVGGETMTSQGPPVIDPTTGGNDDDDPASTGSSTAGSATDGPGMTDEADGPSMTDEADGPSMTDDGPYMDTTGGYTCMGMPPMVGMIGQLCMQYIAHYNDCVYGGMQPYECVAIYEAYCQYDLDSSYMYSPACGAAVAEIYACLSQLPCNQLGDGMDDCPEQVMAIESACSQM